MQAEAIAICSVGNEQPLTVMLNFGFIVPKSSATLRSVPAKRSRTKIP